jgi:N-acetylmuramoyl-L-alanine amidase
MFEVRNHILHKDGVPVAQRPSPNRGGVLKPSLLVMHYTGSTSFDGGLRALTDGKAEKRVSAHLLIGEDGCVAQLVPFNRIAWHAGESVWHGRQLCNSFSVGIEMVNAGLLGKRADGVFYERLTSKTIPASRVALARHKNGSPEEPWEVYPPAQIEAAIGAAIAICGAYGIHEIAGHDDIAPRRKIDPGPAFPMVSFQARVLGRDGKPR